MATKRRRIAEPLPDPEEKIRALSALLDRIIGRHQELVQEVTALKRSYAALKRRYAALKRQCSAK